MGNSRRSTVVETKDIPFSGETQDWEKFHTEINNALEEKEMSWIICVSQSIAKYFQGIVAERTTDKSKQGNPMETDLAELSDKKIKSVTAVMDKMGVKGRQVPDSL